MFESWVSVLIQDELRRRIAQWKLIKGQLLPEIYVGIPGTDSEIQAPDANPLEELAAMQPALIRLASTDHATSILHFLDPQDRWKAVMSRSFSNYYRVIFLLPLTCGF